MTETGMVLSNPIDPGARRPGTVGQPLRGVSVKLLQASRQIARCSENSARSMQLAGAAVGIISTARRCHSQGFNHWYLLTYAGRQ